MADVEDTVGVSHRYFVVTDGGVNAGYIWEGPFQHVTKAIKAKNRKERETPAMCKYRVTEDPEHPRAYNVE